MTKYSKTTQIFIKTKFNINGKSVEVPLKFNDENRKRNFIDYITNLSDDFSNPRCHDELLSELANQSHFNYIYNDLEDNDSNTSLIIDESSKEYLFKLKFDANKYTFSYVSSFLGSIKNVLNQVVNCGIENLKVEDIALTVENPSIKYEHKRSRPVNVLLEGPANKTPETALMNNRRVRKRSNVIGNNTSTDEIEKAAPSATGKYPMSSQQKRLYIIYHKHPDLTNYNLPNVVMLKKSIDIARLEDAINT